MTKREFYESIILVNIDPELTEFARNALSTMDKQVERNRATAARKRQEKLDARADILAAILNCLTNEPKTATTLIEEAGVEVTPQAVSVMMRQPIAEGVVVKGTVKIKGKGAQVGYIRA